jgi:Cdc6-like AAA superfamily ATPase
LVKILNFLFALPCPELKDIIINSEVRPNDEFVDRLAAFAKGSEIFASSDEHKRMIALIDDVSQKGDKHVIIVQGSPGTGKTVAAFNSILYFAKKKKNVVYLTKNSQLRRTFLK